MELGVATFADLHPGVTPRQRMQQLIEEAELADQLGLDVFAVGEHHRADYLVSSPSTALAAIAARTGRIRLSSAVTVLSSDDPIRVFQQFAHVDLISGGRAEIMAGRGSFTESFPLFGLSLDDYDSLYATKLERLLEIREDPAAHGVYPVPVQEPLPVWVAVGGTPQSVARAGLLGLPLTIAIIGGTLERFVPLVNLYREALARSGREGRLAINGHAWVGDAEREFAPGYLQVMNRVGRERGWGPSGIDQFRALASPGGAVHAGDPEVVAEKIVRGHELFKHDRYVGQMSLGSVAHADVLRSMERFGTEVVPLVRRELSAGATP